MKVTIEIETYSGWRDLNEVVKVMTDRALSAYGHATFKLLSIKVEDKEIK